MNQGHHNTQNRPVRCVCKLKESLNTLINKFRRSRIVRFVSSGSHDVRAMGRERLARLLELLDMGMGTIATILYEQVSSSEASAAEVKSQH